MRLPLGERPERQTSVLGDFSLGWSYARALGWVIPVACCSLVFNALISGSLGVRGPVISEQTIGSDGWGFARSGEAVGVFAVTFLLARVTIRRPLRACILGFTASAVPMLLLGTSVPEAMLSRIMAIDGFFSFVALPLGQLAVGPAYAAVGARTVELVSVALCLLVGAVGATRPVIRAVVLDPPPGTDLSPGRSRTPPR